MASSFKIANFLPPSARAASPMPAWPSACRRCGRWGIWSGNCGISPADSRHAGGLLEGQSDVIFRQTGERGGGAREIVELGELQPMTKGFVRKLVRDRGKPP